MSRIIDAESEEDIQKCFPVMSQLREGFSTEEFVSQVVRQKKSGYILNYLYVDDQIMAVAGWRIRESLAMGRHIYVEDLVTREELRGKGLGDALLDYIVKRGTDEGCSIVLLDSGVQRFAAHRFYLRKRFEIRGYLFARFIAS